MTLARGLPFGPPFAFPRLDSRVMTFGANCLADGVTYPHFSQEQFVSSPGGPVTPLILRGWVHRLAFITGASVYATVWACAGHGPTGHFLVTRVPLDGDAFGSAVSAGVLGGTGWIGQPSAGRVSRLSIATGRFHGSMSPGPFPVQIAANGDGSRIYVVNFQGGQVSTIDTRTMSIVATVAVGQDAYGVTSTPTGDTVFVGITNGSLYRIDMRGRTILDTLDLPVAAGYHFEWNKSRTRLYASQRAFDGGRVFEIEPHSFTLLRTFETGGSAQGIQLSADDSRLFVAAQDGGVIVWDVASNSLDTTYATPGCSGYGLLRTPDNAFLVVGCVLNGLVEILDPDTGTLLETLDVGGRPRELSWDKASRAIVVPNELGWVDILRAGSLPLLP